MDQQFLDAIEDRLSAEEKAEFADTLAENADLERSFAEYRAIEQLERMVASQDALLDEDLSDAVFDALSQRPRVEMQTVSQPALPVLVLRASWPPTERLPSSRHGRSAC